MAELGKDLKALELEDFVRAGRGRALTAAPPEAAPMGPRHPPDAVARIVHSPVRVQAGLVHRD